MNIPLKFQKCSKLLRFFSSKLSCDEVKIPVPWGHVAGKWWGPQDKRPILVLHGWQDNCGSFDRLIPMLNPKYGYLAIDFPGHGLSSHLPLGVLYYWIDYVITVRRIVKYFKWPKVSILGHSIGGATGYYYEVIYPGNLDFLISIDALKPITKDVYLTNTGENIDNIIKYDHLMSLGKEGPAHAKEDLIQRLNIDSQKSIDLEVCEYVLTRNIKESSITPNKFYFTRDLRLKVLPLLYPNRTEILENTNRLLCPTLYLKSTDKNKRYKNLTDAQELTDILEKTKKDFEMHMIDGTHHVHLNNPEKLEGFINKFIEKYDIEDRNVH
ncbi:hypothetical protein RN001_012852 [Aquatica leii]|uniref:AB hydrolase-1 domain-containing protein n=1 Tax=Aquatica leii TaxID=1421715 RepID=A0AAN7NYY7_9COLE|nr:hypothetical protein RN001_012852 [Aquatica leii]